MGRKKLLRAFAVGAAVTALLVSSAVLYSLRGMNRAADGFFGAVERNSLTEARPFLAASLRNAAGDAWLKDLLSESELFDARQTHWTSRQSANGFGVLGGTVTRAAGRTVPVNLLFVQEKLDWKLYAIRRPFEGSLPEPLAPLVPGKDEQVTLIKRAIHDFAASVASRNMSYFHSTLAPSRREQVSTETLNQAFGRFFDIDEDLNSLEGIEPSVEQTERSSANGEVTLRGYFDTHPKQVHFQQRYAYEQTDWRLLSFKIEMQ